MKIFAASDFHIDNSFNPDQRILLPDEDYEMLIMAGDIGHRLEGLKWLTRTHPKREIVYVPGNHEFYYSGLFRDTLRDLLFFGEMVDIRVLDNDFIFYNEYMIIGSILWSNFKGANPLVMLDARDRINDFRIIQMTPNQIFSTADCLELHHKSISYLNDTLEENSNPTIIVTHFAPIFPTPPRDNLSYYFCNDLMDLVRTYKDYIKLWVFGHTHSSFDQVIEGVRFFSNPYGYFRVEENLNYHKNIIEI